jgi:Uma2 family endonuclease
MESNPPTRYPPRNGRDTVSADYLLGPRMTAEEFVRRFADYQVELVDGRVKLPFLSCEEISQMSTTQTSPPSTTLLTAEEFVRRYAGQRVELVRGVVKELPMPASAKHGKICAKIARLIGNHVEERDLGHVMSNDSYVKVKSDPDLVRGADVSFYSYERLPKGEVPEGILPVSPDLVVEVRSPSDRWIDVFEKVVEYLGVGVRVVVLVDAVSLTASVYRPDELQRIFDNGDELTVPDVLPGFAVAVRLLFE